MGTIIFEPNKEFVINYDREHSTVVFSHIEIPSNCNLSTCVFRFKDLDSTSFSRKVKSNLALFVNENKPEKNFDKILIILPECNYLNENDDKFVLHYDFK